MSENKNWFDDLFVKAEEASKVVANAFDKVDIAVKRAIDNLTTDLNRLSNRVIYLENENTELLDRIQTVNEEFRMYKNRTEEEFQILNDKIFFLEEKITPAQNVTTTRLPVFL
ncbi:hypothetical protein TetV_207 [Tetraselmis virus 1]|uniref:Uncharacterized protein n=1 Tax=Tetraselmis virus 1 TaxID=2060617 RepID=A0A2P0VNI2_9VIRU|nr:hypothetical protein QJ968_gp207 [Tetraselmis virus 1]AUF82299.1 hypothetical protein TetV_207 [Tetraselmis virus 1]